MILFIAFPFLAAGCACFLFCAAIPRLRRFALSGSLWWVACIPCLFAILTGLILWSLGLDALRRLLRPDLAASLSVHQTSWLGWLLAIITLVVTVTGATAITLIHGIIVRRLTLALFSPVRRWGQFRRRCPHLLFCPLRLRNTPAFAYSFSPRSSAKPVSRFRACLCLFQERLRLSWFLSTAFLRRHS